MILGNLGYIVFPMHRIERNEPKGPQITTAIYTKEFIQANLEQITQNLLNITSDATGMDKDRLIKEQGMIIANSDLIVILENKGSIIGYGAFSIYKDAELPGDIIYEAAKMVKREFQGKGYSRKITRIAIEAISTASHFVFTTQNPAETLSVKRSAPSTLFAPVDTDYDTNPDLQKALRVIATNRSISDLNFSTGVRKGLYGERFGDYETIPPTHLIEEKLLQFGFDRKNGDALYLTGKLH